MVQSVDLCWLFHVTQISSAVTTHFLGPARPIPGLVIIVCGCVMLFIIVKSRVK